MEVPLTLIVLKDLHHNGIKQKHMLCREYYGKNIMLKCMLRWIALSHVYDEIAYTLCVPMVFYALMKCDYQYMSGVQHSIVGVIYAVYENCVSPTK